MTQCYKKNSKTFFLRYRKNANLVSNRFKDRPMTPERSVVYWTEYVCRHKNAPHLKSYSFDLTWYQYYLLDVVAFILLFIISTVYITYKILMCVCVDKYFFKC